MKIQLKVKNLHPPSHFLKLSSGPDWGFFSVHPDLRHQSRRPVSSHLATNKRKRKICNPWLVANGFWLLLLNQLLKTH